MNGTAVLAVVACAWSLSAAATRVMGRVAVRWDLVDRPGGYKTHARPVPYLGGVAIVLGTVVPVLVFHGLLDRRALAIAVAAVAVAVLGLVDDITPLSPRERLMIEAVAATGVVLSGVQAPLTGGWPDGPLTVVWIVVMTNSFNLLDNMDGALGATAVVSGSALAGTAFVTGRPEIGLPAAALACACLGFLPRNWAPAKIFMGDAGSLFIGFVLSSCCVALVTGQESPASAVAGLLLPTFVATVDTGIVVVSRRRAGRPVLSGGRDHLSHRLHRLGLTTRLTALALAAVAGVAGAAALMTALRVIPSLAAAGAAALTALLSIVLAQKAPLHASLLHASVLHASLLRSSPRRSRPARLRERRP